MPVFLILLLFATQMALAMYTTTMVEAVAFDAANQVARAAAAPDRESARADALTEADERLGDLDVTWKWGSSNDEYVELSFVVESPALLPKAFAGHFGFGAMKRQVRVRIEQPR